MAMSRERVEEGGKEEVFIVRWEGKGKGKEMEGDAEEERQRMRARRKMDLRDVLSDILDLREGWKVADRNNMSMRKRFMCTICIDPKKSNLK
jgi:hypothetical protein